jgi:hypothetical protein
MGLLSTGKTRQEGQWDIPEEFEENVRANRDLETALQNQRENALAGAYRLQSGAPYVASQQMRQDTRDNISTVYRTQVGNAAERGLVHSGLLGQIAAQNAKQQGLAQMGLSADEIAQRRSALMALEGQVSAIRAGEEKQRELRDTSIKLGVDSQENGISGEFVEREWERMAGQPDPSAAVTQRRIDQVITAQSAAKYQADDLEARFISQIDKDYNAAEQAAIAEAQRRGVSDDALQGLRMEFRRQRASAYGVARQTAVALTGSDPQQASSTLQALYRVQVPAPQIQEDNFNWGIGLGLGIAGGVVGAFYGGPAGAAGGYQLGKSIGDTGAAFAAYG